MPLEALIFFVVYKKCGGGPKKVGARGVQTFFLFFLQSEIFFERVKHFFGDGNQKKYLKKNLGEHCVKISGP